MIAEYPIHDGLSKEYATSADFGRIFQQHMASLHLLSFLLTADSALAEECFVCGIETCANTSTVFQEWAHSWARRVVVQNAIRLIAPVPSVTPALPMQQHSASTGDAQNATLDASLARVLELGAFERFVFVMSILERHSDQDCSLLLACRRQDVVTARAQALRQLSISDLVHAGLQQPLQVSPELLSTR